MTRDRVENHAVVFSHFAKRFGANIVHRDVSFTVQNGECLGLLGGSGTGKSVLLRTIVGLETPDQGEITVFGRCINGLNEADFIEIRKRVAYVFQNGALFDSMTVFDNLAYALRAHTQLTEPQIRVRVVDLLEEFGLAGSEELYPSSLSGGMQKRVGLARSIILEPDLILYDEPTAGLDPYNTKRICDMMLRLKDKGTTSIFVTHDMPAAFSVCDRVAVLRDGQIFAIGTREQIEAKDPWVNRFIEGEEL